MGNITSSYRLYGIPYLGSMAIEFLMEEAGIKYDIIFLTPEERSSVDFKKNCILCCPQRSLVPIGVQDDEIGDVFLRVPF